MPMQMNARRRSAPHFLLSTKTFNNGSDREKEKQELTSTLILLKKTQDEVEDEKKHKEELEEKLRGLESQLSDATSRLERASGVSKKLREENKVKADKLEKLEGNLIFTEERLKSLESRALEIERMELTIEQLKKSIESNNLTLREKNNEIKILKQESEDLGKKMLHLQTENDSYTQKINDLKSQVKEEIYKNSAQDKKLEKLGQLQEELNSRNENIADLESQLEDKSLILTNARKTLKEEREKLKSVQTSNNERDTLQEDLHIARCENLTLKKLLVGKDVLVIRKTQALNLAKEALKDMQANNPRHAELMSLLDNPIDISTYPLDTNYVRDIQTSGPSAADYTDVEGRCKSAPPASSNKKGNTRPKENTTAIDQRCHVKNSTDRSNEPGDRNRCGGSSFLETILDRDSETRTTKVSVPYHATAKSDLSTSAAVSQERQPKMAVVRPQIYQRTFSNFRSSSTVYFEQQSETSSTSLTDTNHSCMQLVPLKSTNSPRKSIRDLVPVCTNPKAVVRRRSLQSKSAVGLKSDGPTGPLSRPVRPKTAMTGSRSALNENARLMILYNNESTKQVETKRSTSAPVSRVLTAMERDRLATQFVHVGHRALVDLGKKKNAQQLMESAVVKFVGNVKNSSEDYRIYVGVKLDEPVGDTDGIFKGKRYFRCSPQHGKFVKISKVNAILDTKASRFKPIKESMQQYLVYMNQARATASTTSSECRHTDDSSISKSTSITTLSVK